MKTIFPGIFARTTTAEIRKYLLEIKHNQCDDVWNYNGRKCMCKFLILIQQNKLFGNEPVKCTFLDCMYTKQYIKKKVHTLINKKMCIRISKDFHS